MKRTREQSDGIVLSHRGPGLLLQMSDYFGDGLDEGALGGHLIELVTGKPGYLVGLYGYMSVPFDRAPTRLVDELRLGRWTASRELVRYCADDTVHVALIDAVRRAPIDSLMHPARALGFVGGRGARVVLRDRLNEIVMISSTLPPFHFGESMEAVAAALLRLDPDATDAARALVDVFEHPNEDIRYAAVQDAASVFRRCLGSESMALLCAALRELKDAEDALMFLFGAPILAHDHFDVVHRRCREYLGSDDYEVRQWAAVALARIPAPASAEALATLAGWAPRGEPLGLALWVAALVWPLMSSTTAVELVRRGLAAESPMARLRSLPLAERLAGDAARSLLEEAITEEPDSFLRNKMQAAVEVRRSPRP